MKHYRILEYKEDTKIYIIQYSKPIFFKLYYWKNLNFTKYNKYEDALNVVKDVILQQDYESSSSIYHYIDAHKIFKSKKSLKNK
jgi:hypothetical protein